MHIAIILYPVWFPLPSKSEWLSSLPPSLDKTLRRHFRLNPRLSSSSISSTAATSTTATATTTTTTTTTEEELAKYGAVFRRKDEEDDEDEGAVEVSKSNAEFARHHESRPFFQRRPSQAQQRKQEMRERSHQKRRYRGDADHRHSMLRRANPRDAAALWDKTRSF